MRGEAPCPGPKRHGDTHAPDRRLGAARRRRRRRPIMRASCGPSRVPEVPYHHGRGRWLANAQGERRLSHQARHLPTFGDIERQGFRRGLGGVVLYTARRLTPVQMAPIACAWMRDGSPYISPEMVVVPARQIVGGGVTAPILVRCRPIVRAGGARGRRVPSLGRCLGRAQPAVPCSRRVGGEPARTVRSTWWTRERPRAASAWRRIVRARGPKPCRVRRSFSV